MPATIPYVAPDSGKPVFSLPDTKYNFHLGSHTFNGQNEQFMSPSGTHGIASIVARFNYVGELEHGHIKVIGGINNLGIPNESVLLLGTILQVDVIPPRSGAPYQVNFIFRVDSDHPSLNYNSHIGVWNSYFSIPNTNPSSYYRYLFRRNWGPAGVPLNSYVGQVRNIV